MSGERDVTMLRRLDDLERKVEDLMELKAMGKGAVWMLLKLSVLIATVISLIVAAWKAIT